MREEKRRRREDVERQRAIEREAAHLERERQKLHMERVKIEQEKAELLRLERERQKVEREKLERERLELKRQQMRLEENRRVAPPPPPLKRPGSDRRETYPEPERKRLNIDHARRHTPDRSSDRREGPPSRYEGRPKEIGIQKGFKRDFNARGRDDQFSEPHRAGRGDMIRRDTRPNQNSMDHRGPKERLFKLFIISKLAPKYFVLIF